MVDTAMQGYNVTLFTYGQTGSGKTYTIQGLPGAGVRAGQDYDIERHKGLTPRIAEYLIENVTNLVDEDSTANTSVDMAFLEIYNEQVRDLLVPKIGGKANNLEVREDAKHKPYVEGLIWKKCITADQIIKHLLIGNERREVASTKMNEVSSRSHSIVMLRIKVAYDPPSASKPDTEALLYIVDLAGSERQDKTGAEGETLQEAKNINKSLLMLGRAIHAFGEKGASAHVPLRDSKLTRLLKESFGGNSKTWMIATCSASPFNMVETKGTLDYAANAKNITNSAEQNRMARQLELADQRLLNKNLEKKIAELTDQLEDLKKNAEERAKEMAKEANALLAEEMEDLRTANAELEKKLSEKESVEVDLRATIAKGLSSEIADQLRIELDAEKAKVAKLMKELETQNVLTGAGTGPQPQMGKAKASSSHLRTPSPEGMGGKKQSAIQDMVDDKSLSAEERLRRLDWRNKIESSGSFVRKKSFNQLWETATGKSASRAWIGTGNEGGGPGKKVGVDAGSTIEELKLAKKRAIANEDFAEAQRLNEEIKAQQSTPKVSINDLMAARACAIAQEDFAEAQKIQAQINTLKQQHKGEAIGSAMATPRADVFSSNIGSVPSSGRPSDEPLTQGGSGSMFVGRASISLKFLVSGNSPSKYHTLPLECDAAIQIDPMCPPQLIVHIYNYEAKKGQPKPDDGRMDFVVDVIQAKGIPKQFSASVHCKYIFKWGEKEFYKSPEVKGSTDPMFNYKKRYAFPQLTDQLYGWFKSEDVLTFQVIGVGSGRHSDPSSSLSADPRDFPAGRAGR
eukprot:TRINITY_DN9489_c0_g2_i2.p1 TRINITY_DN9489_c0_g2~~TRINITY_DN9489_c0_g2_i2.p1  ORF type:complete len:888 (+),score=216.88 TRINITY_DN9489_c0_g2_i2:271-2664(+)